MQENRTYEGDGCPVCLVPHQDDIHAASLSVHAYMRERLEVLFAPAPERDHRKLMPTISVPAFPARLRRPEPLRVDRPAVEAGPVRAKAAKVKRPRKLAKVPAIELPSLEGDRCKRGHLWTPANTQGRIVKGRNVRECRMCRSILHREAYKRMKEAK